MKCEIDKKIPRLKKTLTRKHKRLIFYCVMMIFPVLQFLVFYVYVKANSFILAFQEYTVPEGETGFKIAFAGLSNIKVAWEKLLSCGFMVKNSLLFYAADLIFSVGVALIFSYYITKKYLCAGIFKTFLFLPQILSGVVFGLLFRYLVNDVYAYFRGLGTEEEVLGLLQNPSTRFWTVLFYNVWTCFGVNILLFSGAMSGINESVIESAELDGCTGIKQFFYISLPMIYPTINTVLMLGLMGVFTNQRGLYTIYDRYAGGISTLGYELYVQAQGSDVILTPGEIADGRLNYSELSALGLIITLIVFPIVRGIDKGLKKFGPSVD